MYWSQACSSQCRHSAPALGVADRYIHLRLSGKPCPFTLLPTPKLIAHSLVVLAASQHRAELACQCSLGDFLEKTTHGGCVFYRRIHTSFCRQPDHPRLDAL